VRAENITPFTERFTRGRKFLSIVYLTKWTCRDVQCLRNDPASVSASDRCKPVLDRGDEQRGAAESPALQRPAAPCPPHQPQIPFPTAGLLWRENPSKCCRKSPEKQTKLSPLIISQWPWQSRFLPKPAFLAGPVREDGPCLPPSLLNPIPSLWGIGEQERLGASKTPFLQQLLRPRCPAGFTACVNSLLGDSHHLGSCPEPPQSSPLRGPSQASPHCWLWGCPVHVADKTLPELWAPPPRASQVTSVGPAVATSRYGLASWLAVAVPSVLASWAIPLSAPQWIRHI